YLRDCMGTVELMITNHENKLLGKWSGVNAQQYPAEIQRRQATLLEYSNAFLETLADKELKAIRDRSLDLNREVNDDAVVQAVLSGAKVIEKLGVAQKELEEAILKDSVEGLVPPKVRLQLGPDGKTITLDRGASASVVTRFALAIDWELAETTKARVKISDRNITELANSLNDDEKRVIREQGRPRFKSRARKNSEQYIREYANFE